MSKEILHKIVPEKMQSIKENKNTKIYPTFSIDDEDLPELKDWKVGKKYNLVMEVEQMSIRQGKDYQGDNEDDNKIKATFKILKIGVDSDSKEDTSGDYETEYAKRMSASNKTKS